MRSESWESATIAFYSRIAANYQDRIRSRREYLDAVEALTRRHLEKYLSEGHTSKSRLLDVGTGDGTRLARIVKGLDLSIHCCEPSRMALAIKRKPALANAKVSNSNFLDFDADRDKFQHITMLWNVLGHMESPKHSLQRVHDLLSEGGTFVFDVNSLRNISEYGLRALTNYFVADGVARFEAQDSNAGRVPVWLFSRRALENWSRDCGFSSVDFFFLNYHSGKLEHSDRQGQIVGIFQK